jgi:hypothetical protein
MSLEEQFRRACGRASYEAWVYLKQLRSHPKFPDLLQHLDALRGTLHKTHIEEMFQRVLSLKERRTASRRSVLRAQHAEYGSPPLQERRAMSERHGQADRRSDKRV